jgi:hypothetical protein
MKIPCGERLCLIVGEKFNALVLEGWMDFKKIELGEVEVIFLGERKKGNGSTGHPYREEISPTEGKGRI